jgi:hypothetical protein
MKDPDLDEIKTQAEMRKAAVTKCEMPGCNNTQTMYRGTGSIYCREHQLKTADRGGYGKMGKNHTFHRSDVCDNCGEDINQDPRWIKCEENFGVLDDTQRLEVKRRYMHGDHQIRAADGGEGSEENTKSSCPFCHWYKTTKNDDGRPGELNKN